MPPGAPLVDQAQGMPMPNRISMDDLHKRMQVTESNASSIERQLLDVRAHLKTLREHVSLDEKNVQTLLDFTDCYKPLPSPPTQTSHSDHHLPPPPAGWSEQNLLVGLSATGGGAGTGTRTRTRTREEEQLELEKGDNVQVQVHDQVRAALGGVEADMSRLKRRIDEVQTELQISWMSLTTLQFQLKVKHHHAHNNSSNDQQVVQSRLAALEEQLNKKNRVLEHLSGAYELLRQSFLDKEEEVALSKQVLINTIKGLSLTDRRDLDSGLESLDSQVFQAQVRDWCASTERKAEQHCAELKQLRAELASIASSLLHIMDLEYKMEVFAPPPKIDTIAQHRHSPPPMMKSTEISVPNGLSPLPPSATALDSMKREASAGLESSEIIFEHMSTRIDALVQELKSERVQQDKMVNALSSSPAEQCARRNSEDRDNNLHQVHVSGGGEAERREEICVSSSNNNNNNEGIHAHKRKLSEAFQPGLANLQTSSSCTSSPPCVDIVDREKHFLAQKKAFLSGLRDSFKRVRQRELVCATLDRRLLKVRLLLEQVQRGCVSSDYVSMKSKRQIEQAYKELIHVQHDIENIKAVSLEVECGSACESGGFSISEQHTELPGSNPSCVPASSWDIGKLKSELGRQVEMNMRLKQQVAKFCLQAERAEGVVAVERLEVDKLRQQVQRISERLKLEARGLAESHSAALRARDLTIERLREQIINDEQRRALQAQLTAALQRNEELSVERDKLVYKLGGQDLDILKLRNENVCLVVEKIAFEGSARAFQEKMATVMNKLSQIKQNWKRFVVYCEMT